MAHIRSRALPNLKKVTLEGAIFALFVIGIGFAPFWFASNVKMAWGANAVFYGLLLSVYELSLVSKRAAHPVALRYILPSAVAFAAVALWIVVQWVGWTPRSWHHPLWEMGSNVVVGELEGSITVNPKNTFVAGMRLLTAAAVFWLALQLCRDPARASRFLQTVAMIGIAYAGYGLIAFLFFPDSILWFEKLYYKASLTSTFINRNNYATFAGITLLACLGALVTIYRRAVAHAAGVMRYQLGALIESTAGRGGIMLLGLFVVAAALMLTGSRAGITSSLAGLLVFCGLLVTGGRKHGYFIGVVVLAVVLLVLVSFIVYGELYLDRLNRLHDPHRLAVYKITWRSIMDAPLLGMGYGTFADIFPMYRDANLYKWGIWDKAHNTYLELLQGLGLPAGFLLIGCVLFLVLQCFRGALNRRRDAIHSAVAASASVVVGLHALVDFSLQIQAVTLTWMALLGMGVAQSWSSQISTDDK